jgi:HlyD family secretion protein
MANLDTVQVRTLVDETDIGKIQPEMPVTITVDAYPNRPFEGSVLKVEPQAVTQQNVTMFPVLIRIANQQGLLKPGMNADVEVHIGERHGVLAVPNAALRTQRDVSSAAGVLGLSQETVDQQLAQGREQGAQSGGQASPRRPIPRRPTYSARATAARSRCRRG